VEAFLDRVRRAWDGGDAHEYALQFSEDACYVIFLGEVMFGRAQIEENHTPGLTKWQKGTRMVVKPLRIRPIESESVSVVTIGGIGQGPDVAYDKFQTYTFSRALGLGGHCGTMGSPVITRTSARGALGPTTGSCVGWWSVGTVASRRFARPAAAPSASYATTCATSDGHSKLVDLNGHARNRQLGPRRSIRWWDQLRQVLLRPQILVKGQAALGACTQQPDDELLQAHRKRLERRLHGTETERRRLVDL